MKTWLGFAVLSETYSASGLRLIFTGLAVNADYLALHHRGDWKYPVLSGAIVLHARFGSLSSPTTEGQVIRLLRVM